MKTIRPLAAIIFLALMATPAFPQSLPNLALSRLNYTVTKRTKNPQGELKDKLDAIDKDLAEATRLGKNGEVRRLLSKGLTVLAGNEWTDAMDYKSSLVLRSDRILADSAKPYVVRLEQIYSSSLPLDHSLTAHLALCKSSRPLAGLAVMGAPPYPAEVVKDLGKFDEVNRDLRESPFLMEANLYGVADGSYQIQAEVLDGDRSLGLAALKIVVQKGLDDAVVRIEAEASHAPEAVRADARYPVDRIRNVNLERIEMGTFDLAKELASAEQVLADAKSGKDPFTSRTGDFKRHYFLKAAGEIMPYHLYVPTTYTPAHVYPLIVALHGLGANEDSMLSVLYGIPKLAEQHGYIVAAPLGYRVDAGYGAFRPAGQTNRRADLSEQDVLEVIQLVKQQYKIDENRIYLMGHSMGGYGTWALAAAHPEIWAALGPISGGGNPASVEKMKAIPEIVVHGDKERTPAEEEVRHGLQLILFGEVSLRRALQQYEAHYHEERNHQGKENLLLFPSANRSVSRKQAAVRCRERLGGLLKYYERQAARARGRVFDHTGTESVCGMPVTSASDRGRQESHAA